MTKLQIFIDAEYLLQSLRVIRGKTYNIPKESFNWEKFIKYISAGRQVERVNYYTARLDEVENKATFDAQTVFLDNVKNNLVKYDFNLRLGKLIKIKNKTQKTWNEQRNTNNKAAYSWGQKGIDTKIILDICKYAYEEFEENCGVVLVSGDEDFAEVLQILRERNIDTELVSFDRRDTKLSETFQNIVGNIKVISLYDLENNKII